MEAYFCHEIKKINVIASFYLTFLTLFLTIMSQYIIVLTIFSMYFLYIFLTIVS